MKYRYVAILVSLIVVVGFSVCAAAPQDKFRLKPGAKGKVCLGCHPDFTEKLKSAYVHTPVKTGDCSGCHNPHTSRHGKLLAAEAGNICLRCHKSMVPGKAASVHSIVAEGQCVKCHDPHASNNKFVLLKKGSELCFDCHKEMGAAVSKAKFKHSPVERSCLSCHDAHASVKAKALLKNTEPALCLQCHKADKPTFVAQHMRYPVGQARCTTCHDTHGSDRGGILYTNIHRPVANKQCSQCHGEPASQKPFAVKKEGYELCRGCHAPMVNEALSKSRLHWPIFGKEGCTTCHSPHGSPQGMLLREKPLSLCGQCHPDTIERQVKSKTKHKPVGDGNCAACHAPHASDSVFLLKQASVVDLCGSCHDWHKHSTHPIGEKYADSRNKNLRVDCLSCHRSHGTEFKNMSYFPTETESCSQCHAAQRR